VVGARDEVAFLGGEIEFFILACHRHIKASPYMTGYSSP
jgi:hypothetical protein